MMNAEVKVFPTYTKTNFIATATIVLKDVNIKIAGLRIIKGTKGLFVQFPTKEVVNKKTGEKENMSIVFPISNEAREEISNLIINEYRNTVQGMLDVLGESA